MGGNINLPIYVRIAGSTKPPLVITITANAVGPIVLLEKQNIDWGKIPALKDEERTIRITNDSLIPAPFKTFIKKPKSNFRVDLREGCLAPQESVTLKLTAFLDDTTMHKDALQIVVTEGENLVVPLSARGIGTTMFCEETGLGFTEIIEYDHKFTSQVCTRKF